MKNTIIKLAALASLAMFYLTSSHALVLDFYSVSGIDTPEKRTQMIEGFEKFKNSAESGGAKWMDFTLQMKIKGDNYNEQMLFGVVYENYQDMLDTNALFAMNSKWFDDNFNIDTDNVINAVMETPPGADIEYEKASVGNTNWFVMLEVTDFLNFLNRVQQLPALMDENGTKGDLGILSCSICPASLGKTTHMMFLSNDTMADMGADLDNFDLDSQIWFYRNIRPFVEQVDAGMNMVIAN